MLALMPAIALAQTTAISGRVTAEGSGEPLPETRVIVIGTTLFASTNGTGQYTIRGVPAGTFDIRVLRVGYAEQKKPITVSAGQTSVLDFVMTPVVVKLQEVVTTATGEQRRVELGNNVANVDAATRVQTAPVTDVASLLVGQAAGVQVMPGNTTGTGARIRIRGTNSLSLVNDPIYIIDGVRMTSPNGSQSGNIFTGGAIQSRAQDLNPDEIENIEIVKGPSAATLYGTDAANGVIVITTKRGRAGATRYNVFGEAGAIHDYNTWPTAYTLLGHTAAAPATAIRCTLSTASAGTCIPDSLAKFNLFENPNTTPLGTGSRKSAGLQASGGSDIVRFFTSGEYEDEIGVLKIPNFDIQRLDTTGVNALQEWRQPNELTRSTMRANLNATPSPKLDLAVSTGFIHLMTRLPQSDNNALGLLSNGFGGPGFEGPGPGYVGISTLGYALHGYRASTPAESFQDVSTQMINRFIGSANGNWRPTSWMLNRANIGVDYTSRIDQQLCRRGTCADVGTTRQGFVEDDRAGLRNFTMDLGSTLTFQPREWFNSKTTVGAQYVNFQLDRNGSGGSNLTPGTQTANGAAVVFADASTDVSKTLGYFVEEQGAFRDRLFLTAAVRTDQNSAFGTNFQRVYYPKFSLSWLISDESFFPRPSWLSQLRLRSAYGASGVQPGPDDALRFFSPQTVNAVAAAGGNAQDLPGVQFTTIGNANLRPERATEYEGGFDAGVLDNRAHLEITYYSKLTHDALVSLVLPPSLGAGATSQRTNLGSVKNDGLEAMINAQLLSRRALGWDVTLSSSSNRNKLVSLGLDATGKPIPPVIGATIRQQPGYPLNGWWQQRILSWNDANNDGIITANEIRVADSPDFIAYSIPKIEASLTNGFDLLNRSLRVQALFDYKGGYKQLNGTDRIRCQSRNNCRELSDKSAPFWRQARNVALRDDPSHTQVGFMEDASFVRFRELSLSYTLPERLSARYLASKGATATFAVRNLHKWTNYTGIDPEANADAGSTANVASDFQTIPPPTYFIFRLNLAF